MRQNVRCNGFVQTGRNGDAPNDFTHSNCHMAAPHSRERKTQKMIKMLNYKRTGIKKTCVSESMMKVAARVIFWRESVRSVFLFIANMELREVLTDCSVERLFGWLVGQLVGVLELQRSWSVIRLKFKVVFLIYRSFVLFKCNVALQHLTNPPTETFTLPVSFLFVFWYFAEHVLSFHPSRLGWKSPPSLSSQTVMVTVMETDAKGLSAYYYYYYY